MWINFALLIATIRQDMLKIDASLSFILTLYDILTFLHTITFMIQTKTNGAELAANIYLNNTSEKTHFVYQLPHFGKMFTVTWIRNKPFFVATQIHICYYLSVSRLPLKVREDRCSLLYKRRKHWETLYTGKTFIRQINKQNQTSVHVNSTKLERFSL